MASIRKKGTGYEIRITDGYDSTGKQITISRMFKPKETWSEKKALSEARKFADSLENRMKTVKIWILISLPWKRSAVFS